MTHLLLQIGEVKVPLCMVDLAQTIEEWKDIQSIKVDDQVSADLMTKRGSQICTTQVTAITHHQSLHNPLSLYFYVNSLPPSFIHSFSLLGIWNLKICGFSSNCRAFYILLYSFMISYIGTSNNFSPLEAFFSIEVNVFSTWETSASPCAMCQHRVN